MNKVVRTRLAAATLAGLAALTVGSAPALAGTFADVHVINRATGQRLPVYQHGGKLYVAGNPGDRYSVQVVNRSGARILSVVSVDGVNVVSGETASPEQTGYVFHPWQSYEINGWRKSASEVAAFYFTALPDSYAARTDRPHNVGVIGVAVFREWTPPPRPRPLPHPMPAPRSQSNEGAGAAADSAKAQNAPGESNLGRRAESRSDDVRSEAPAEAPASPSADAKSAEAERAAPNAADRVAPGAPSQRLRDRIGTGHGEREQSHVSYTNFRRASSQPNEVITIHYDRYENLAARGIVPGWPPVAAEPRPFPAAPATVRFVPDPRR